MFGKEIESDSMNYYGITNSTSLGRNGETHTVLWHESYAVFCQQT